jgi:hypothetical protein
MIDADYGDAYATCVETHSTLRIFSDDIGPDRITSVLGISPTDSFHQGESSGNGRQRKTHGWFYSTEQSSSSKDTRHHIDIILAMVEGKDEKIAALRQKGCEFDIVSYWVSRGQGGPELLPHQMLKLGTLGISIWWDIYFKNEPET